MFVRGERVKTESISEICRRQGLNRFTAFVLVFLHVGAVAALFMFSWKALAVSVLFYCISIGLGISMGYHRLHTHRSYKVPLWLEYFFAIVRHADARRRADFLGGHAPHASSALGPARRSAFAARRRLLEPHGLDSVGRQQPQQHPHAVQVRTGSGQAPLLRVAE